MNVLNIKKKSIDTEEIGSVGSEKREVMKEEVMFTVQCVVSLSFDFLLQSSLLIFLFPVGRG